MARNHKALDQLQPWRDSAQELECVMVVPEAPNTKTFAFRAPDDSWFRYQPGQFLTVELPTPEGSLHRTYTISSSPSRPLSLTLTVKAQEGSVGSRWMLDNLKVGDRLKAKGPGGLFSITNYPNDKYLFLSAGSGITPMMSMMRWLYDYGTAPDVTLINCARSPAELIFRNDLERMAARLPSIRLAWIVEEPDPFDVWTGFLGRFNQLILELTCPDYATREIFCCGPAPFMEGVRDVLNVAGFDFDHYHEESFQQPIRRSEDIPEWDEVVGDVPDEEASARVVFTQSNKTVVCHQTDTLLDVAKRAGLFVPSSCQFGVCGTCKLKKRAGEVHMVHNGGIDDEEIEEGYVLACCSNPIGRVELEF
ncbi:MAG: 2Fe-2S iron-sulfur cluster-binding protein [Candidatus Competibacterales bacterium]